MAKWYLIIPVGVAATLVALAYFLWDTLSITLLISLWVALGLSGLTAAVWLARYAFGSLVTSLDQVDQARHNKAIRAAEVRKVNAEAARMEAEADAARVTTVTAPLDHQIHIRDAAHAVWRPAHLDARRYANGPGSDRDPAGPEAAAWASWHIAHGKRQQVPLLENPHPVNIEEAHPALLPELLKAQRLLIAGGSDSGKTTLAKHLLAAHSADTVVVIDPHSPSKVLGYDVIGSGRDYEAIDAALESLVLLMDARYNEIADGASQFGQQAKVLVLVDEWTSIVEQCSGAAQALTTLLTESRKVNFWLTVLTHSENVETMGISARIRESARTCRLSGGNGEPRRAFLLPTVKTTPDGKRATPTEYQLPGPFAEYPALTGDVVQALPGPRELRAQAMHDAGESITAIARMYYDTEKPNGTQTKAMRNLLEEARQNRDKATEHERQ